MTLWGMPLAGCLLLGGTAAGVTLLRARGGHIRGPRSVGLYVLSSAAPDSLAGHVGKR